MQAYPASVPLPSSDKRWKLVEATMRRHGHKSSSLIEVLHTVQESFGYLDEISLRFVASSLRLPLSTVFGVATYYHFFSLKPPGEHTCVVCMGTGCYVKGAGNLMKAIEEVAHVGAGETTPDGKVSVVAARCIGACSLSPAVVYDGEVIPKVQPAALKDQLRRWMGHDAG
jgi:bidirectional [NiFe] hydrogenase diaphorase subunit